MEKPYLISSVIGNGRMLATLGRNTELYRIFWPHIDNFQHLQNSFAGIFMHGAMRWLTDPGLWRHEQSYCEDTNVVETLLQSHDGLVQVRVVDFVEPERDVLVRHFEIGNLSDGALPARFVCFAAFNFQNNPYGNGVLYAAEYDALLYYGRGYYFLVGGDRANNGFQAGAGALDDAHDGYLHGAVLNMSPEGCQVWDLGSLEKGQKTELTLFFCPGKTWAETGHKLQWARQQGYRQLFAATKHYWTAFLARGRQVHTDDADLNALYKRSLLVGGLLCDRENGGIIAAPEMDEKYIKSGGYGYCWPRDCVFVADAMARAGYGDIAARFYRWAARTQLPEGDWYQRYDTEGNLAPGWGKQVDQTGAVLWGIWQYVLVYEDMDFLRELWPTVFKGAVFLSSFVDRETALPLPSFDLWEERLGEHAYSAAAVYGGLMGAADMARKLGYDQEADNWHKTALNIAHGIVKYLWDQEKKSFIRTVKKTVDRGEYEYHRQQGNWVATFKREKGYEVFQIWKDDLTDASLLGLVYPFEVFSPVDEKIKHTVDWIERVLTCPRTGGIKRYENDHYIGGNPWVNTTLWLAIYMIRAQRREQAKLFLRWAINHRTETGLLPEQVDRNSGRPAWIIPLSWSHAMFILAVLEFLDSGNREEKP
ncbi:glycoside hydrolase 15-like protein [Thermincola ferriacetica]|uniref:Glycoside hydrolase 15-like protein n=1 Tax=Thermincola ferriacetica TaxID=281456 RepID=A0A0L6VYQ5_9FIRM|nr:glycoside hydrolase family 15 protein [Thermincola ferriacetica]KNZ68442.1 glycoside hydrolase 15-like protein [Thermincola ferriacetica]